MNLSEQWVFPVASNCIYSGVLLIYEGGNLILLFDYYDENNNDKIFNSGIVFETTIAHRHSSEKVTKFISGTYDKLVEVKDSEWLKELTDISPEWVKYWNVQHYAIYLDSHGLYEFIAENFKILDIKEGALERRGV
jgi:hypothetical protein